MLATTPFKMPPPSSRASIGFFNYVLASQYKSHLCLHASHLMPNISSTISRHHIFVISIISSSFATYYPSRQRRLLGLLYIAATALSSRASELAGLIGQGRRFCRREPQHYIIFTFFYTARRAGAQQSTPSARHFSPEYVFPWFEKLSVANYSHSAGRLYRTIASFGILILVVFIFIAGAYPRRRHAITYHYYAAYTMHQTYRMILYFSGFPLPMTLARLGLIIRHTASYCAHHQRGAKASERSQLCTYPSARFERQRRHHATFSQRVKRWQTTPFAA